MRVMKEHGSLFSAASRCLAFRDDKFVRSRLHNLHLSSGEHSPCVSGVPRSWSLALLSACVGLLVNTKQYKVMTFSPAQDSSHYTPVKKKFNL